MSDTGRKVHQEHLRVVADRLSVTGQFSGLSRKGLKLKNPTPFNQAAFSVSIICVVIYIVWFMHQISKSWVCFFTESI